MMINRFKYLASPRGRVFYHRCSMIEKLSYNGLKLSNK